MMAWVRWCFLVGVLAVAGPSAAGAQTFEEKLEAAEQGDIEAQFSVGFNYEFGWDVEKDYRKAAYWYRKAADQGDVSAQHQLGLLYSIGNGVSRDYEEAAHWYRKAADQGLSNAQYLLGSLYHEGRGVTRDYEEAAYWYRKAADQGFVNAQTYLGNFYYNGTGVSRDYVEAYKWFLLAHARGRGPYSDTLEWFELLDDLEEKLTPEQIAEGQRLAREWRPNGESP